MPPEPLPRAVNPVVDSYQRLPPLPTLSCYTFHHPQMHAIAMQIARLFVPSIILARDRLFAVSAVAQRASIGASIGGCRWILLVSLVSLVGEEQREEPHSGSAAV
jgi:hypothetical protein